MIIRSLLRRNQRPRNLLGLGHDPHPREVPVEIRSGGVSFRELHEVGYESFDLLLQWECLHRFFISLFLSVFLSVFFRSFVPRCSFRFLRWSLGRAELSCYSMCSSPISFFLVSNWLGFFGGLVYDVRRFDFISFLFLLLTRLRDRGEEITHSVTNYLPPGSEKRHSTHSALGSKVQRDQDKISLLTHHRQVGYQISMPYRTYLVRQTYPSNKSRTPTTEQSEQVRK